ncbi:monovalent cation/H+ antiporter subunit E [Haloterrigena sp. SYSU A121-1]|uniref:Monovalent cation/H+ antiporter subunit E n=1 Tax=Haloterrigena gelatinilytica TaxID=2741724 RepID=A0A8J8GU09_9EURY|nr:monovalent cation/H+ antiporter subunit E [Haloterrigena gelatinilytica]NUB93977.1 monovalent cation/H+ antiporter subunit E [Haloterrigena gelatinilytica]
MAAERVLVPLSDTVTVRQTVGYAIQSGLETADSLECHLVIALPYDVDLPEGKRLNVEAEELLERAENWVEEDAGGADVTIETAVLGTDEYLFGPRDYAEIFRTYADDHGIDRLVLDPEYSPGVTASMLQPLERELERVDMPYDEAPVERAARHGRLVLSRDGFDRLFATFWISFGFYLVLGDPFYWFDLLTGAAVAGIVSVSLAHVTFSVPLDRVQSPLRAVRFVFYIPYLLWEIVKANIAVSAVILRPSMPIEPTLTRVNARVRSGLPLLALANSITLTPGTLTVRANDQQLLVHTLIPSAREDLFDGGLEKAIRFVFYGRESAAIPSPNERDDAEIVGGDEL